MNALILLLVLSTTGAGDIQTQVHEFKSMDQCKQVARWMISAQTSMPGPKYARIECVESVQ